MKKVSVVVPCYNAAAYLDKCIRYLLHQTIGIENMEIILVDDASTDGGTTWNLIMGYERQFPDTVMAVSLKENMRQGGARNVGISYASGEYLIFCDSDDWLLEEALEHCYCAAKKYNADMVEFLAYDVHDHDLTIEPTIGTGNRLIELDSEEKRKHFFCYVDNQYTLASQKKLYRLSMIKENHIAFAEHLIFEEPSFTLPIRLYEKRHYFLNEKLYVYYLSQGSTVRSDWGQHKWDNPKVWMHLLNDLTERGALDYYYNEIECLFFCWGLSLSIRMVLQKGYTLAKDELKFLVDMVTVSFPNVRNNLYIRRNKKIWDNLVLKLLDLEISDESVSVINEILRKYI